MPCRKGSHSRKVKFRWELIGGSYVISNTSTTCDSITMALRELGWNASAIRPTGKNSWVVCSADEPPATHLCIGNDYVAVMPAKSQTSAKSSDTPVSTVQIGANFLSPACVPRSQLGK